jgi:hypothetical protein
VLRLHDADVFRWQSAKLEAQNRLINERQQRDGKADMSALATGALGYVNGDLCFAAAGRTLKYNAGLAASARFAQFLDGVCLMFPRRKNCGVHWFLLLSEISLCTAGRNWSMVQHRGVDKNDETSQLEK